MFKKIALIGLGYFGPNIYRVLTQFKEIEEIVLCDLSLENLKKVKTIVPGPVVSMTQDIETIYLDKDIQCVFVATPGNTHFTLCERLLRARKHIFVEKPLAFNKREAQELINIAANLNRLLHVDHTFVYTPEVNFLKQCLQFNVLGHPSSFRSTRANLGPFMSNIDVVYDLAVHDLAIIKYLFPAVEFHSVSATAHKNKAEKIDDADITLFAKGFGAHIHVSWFYPKKVREVIVGGTNGLFHHDSAMNNPPRIVNFDGEILTYEHITNLGEPLKVEINHFFECLKRGEETLSTGKEAFEVVKILQAASLSIAKSGELVKID